jgi:hypothetical protein
VTAYIDANFANAPGRKSVLGIALFINYYLIVWQSKKQSIVTTSTSKAEYITLFKENKEVYWIRRLLFEISYSQYGSTLVLENNQTYITFTKEKNNYQKTKHIDVKYHFTRELISNKHI